MPTEKAYENRIGLISVRQSTVQSPVNADICLKQLGKNNRKQIGDSSLFEKIEYVDAQYTQQSDEDCQQKKLSQESCTFLMPQEKRQRVTAIDGKYSLFSQKLMFFFVYLEK